MSSASAWCTPRGSAPAPTSPTTPTAAGPSGTPQTRRCPRPQVRVGPHLTRTHASLISAWSRARSRAGGCLQLAASCSAQRAFVRLGACQPRMLRRVSPPRRAQLDATPLLGRARRRPAGYGSFDCVGCIPDTVNHTKFVRDLYEMADDKTGGWPATHGRDWFGGALCCSTACLAPLCLSATCTTSLACCAGCVQALQPHTAGEGVWVDAAAGHAGRPFVLQGWRCDAPRGALQASTACLSCGTRRPRQ
jgi:hypothetical protein